MCQVQQLAATYWDLLLTFSYVICVQGSCVP